MKSSALLLAFFLLGAVSSVHAQVGKDVGALIELLKSESVADRTRASKEVFGAGIRDEAVYAQISLLVEAGMEGIDKKSPRVDELAWHVKALASSGDISYMPLIDQAVNSGVGSLARHAKDAKKILIESVSAGRPYLLYTNVPVLTERQADGCRYITQKMCETSRSAERCIAHHQVNAIDSGGNAIVLVHSTSRSVGFGPFGGDTTMLANYYSCQ